MVVFLITFFAAAPIDRFAHPSAVVYANDRDEAIKMLKAELDSKKIEYLFPDNWVVTPLTPLPKFKKAIVCGR